MTIGIRAYTNANFKAMLPKLAELGATAFRREVMDLTIVTFGISVESAATHYNHSLKTQRLVDPKSVEGLGRPEGKKGGRKVTNPVTVVKAKSGDVVAENISRGKADTLIITAALKKRTKLIIKEDASEPAIA